MYVYIRDWYGILDKFKVMETGKSPEGFGKKVSVLFINSRGDKERAIVNPNHIQAKPKTNIKTF